MISTAISCNEPTLPRNFSSYPFLISDTSSLSEHSTAPTAMASFVAPSMSFTLGSTATSTSSPTIIVPTPTVASGSSPSTISANRTPLNSINSPFPPYVSKPMSEWSVEDVYEWSRQFLDEEDAEKLRKQKIKGSSLIQVTEERLQSYGLLGGPSMDLLSAINGIKLPGQLSSTNSTGLRNLQASNPSSQPPINDDKDDSRQIADFLQKLSQQKNAYHKEDSPIESLISTLERRVNEIAQNQEHLSFRVTKLQQDYLSLKQLQSNKFSSPFLDHNSPIHISEGTQSSSPKESHYQNPLTPLYKGPPFPLGNTKLASTRMNPHFMSPHTTSQSLQSTPSPHDSANGNILLPIPAPSSTAVVNYVPPKSSITDFPPDTSFSRSPTPPSIESISPRGRNKRSSTPDSKSEPPSKKSDLKLLRKGPRNRVKWTPELIELFHQALRKLGDNAVPSAILDEMNIDGLTRENVASHLQKHRLQTAAKMKQSPTPTPSPTGSSIPLPSASQLIHPLHHLT
eukprot:TRINITY_DN1031_c0_g3_i3.p1 TRINITY_DN1031_c0_g3~~TRINITY_DN1031_c0_g3_i3.p1  ORF type:complete len:512 (-),score=84.70 TRINITY_DN1031_c0_g3_i3:401-1936(-)